MAYKPSDLRTEVELSQVNQLLGRLNAMLPGADHRQLHYTFNDDEILHILRSAAAYVKEMDNELNSTV